MAESHISKQQINMMITTRIIHWPYTLIYYQYIAYFIIVSCFCAISYCKWQHIFHHLTFFRDKDQVSFFFFCFKAGGLESAEKTHTLRILFKKNLAILIETKSFHAFPGQHQEAEGSLLATPLLPLFPGTIIFPQSGDRTVTQNPLLSLSHTKEIIQSIILAIPASLKEEKL